MNFPPIYNALGASRCTVHASFNIPVCLIMLAPIIFTIQVTQGFFLFNFFLEQGRRIDLLTRHDGHVPLHPNDRNLINSNMMMRSLVSTPGLSTNIKSDSVHCNPLSRVTYGSRCHTADYLKDMKDVDHCEKPRQVALSQSDRKHVFTDYGKHVTNACVGPKPSIISNTVLDNLPFVDALPQCQWEKLVWLMKCAETFFRAFTDHCVISHLHHANKLAPFKTFSDKSSTCSSDFFGGIAFGSNVFLHCHTDTDFTMSISQVFLRGRPEYCLNNDVITYFFYSWE